MPAQREAWDCLTPEFTALMESGRWNQAAELVEANLDAFSSRADIFLLAVNYLSMLPGNATLPALVNDANPNIGAFPPRCRSTCTFGSP